MTKWFAEEKKRRSLKIKTPATHTNIRPMVAKMMPTKAIGSFGRFLIKEPPFLLTFTVYLKAAEGANGTPF